MESCPFRYTSRFPLTVSIGDVISVLQGLSLLLLQRRVQGLHFRFLSNVNSIPESVPLQVVSFSLESLNHPLGFFQIGGQYGVILLQVGYHGLQLLVMDKMGSHFGGLVFYASVDCAFLT